MLKENITVLVQTTVAGPKGHKLRPGKVVELEDSPYTRILIKSGTVSLIDPPSLDPDFLEGAGYELRDGYSYPEKQVPEEPVAKPESEPVAEPFVGMQSNETIIKAPYALTTSVKKTKVPKGKVTVEEGSSKAEIPKEITGM